MNAHQPLSNSERVARRRKQLRAQGLAPRQFWLPDLRDPVIAAEIADEARRIAATPDDIMDFVAAVQYWPPDE